MVFINLLELICCATYIIMACTINTRNANLLIYCWNSLLALFLGITEMLGIFGWKIGNKTGVIIVSLLGFGIPGYVPFGKILCFIGQMVDTGTMMVIFTMLGLKIPRFVEICQDDRLATTGLWGEFRDLSYVIASAFMIFRQNHLIGAACSFAIMELFVKDLHIPLEYIFVLVGASASIPFVYVLYGTWIPNLLRYCWNSTEIRHFVEQKINEPRAVMTRIQAAVNNCWRSVLASLTYLRTGRAFCGRKINVEGKKRREEKQMSRGIYEELNRRVASSIWRLKEKKSKGLYRELKRKYTRNIWRTKEKRSKGIICQCIHNTY